ncbi:MAG: insulinase family protein [Planctomycetaceae bacterium]|nr:insulinase family protein [Planctomycetaceae bacterium]
MQLQEIQTHTLANGLTLIVEPMRAVQSAAFSLLLPAGSNYDPPDRLGSASVLCELIMRGAGERNSRDLTEALEQLGVQHREHTGNSFLTFSAASVAETLPESLRIFGDIVRRPHLPEDQFEAARAGIVQSLRSVEDEPRQKVMIELRRRCFDAPWGLPSDGTLETVAQLTPDLCRHHFESCVRPNGSILAVAGNVDPAEVIRLTEDVFGDWPVLADPVPATAPRGPHRDHLSHDSEQTHIGVAWDSVPYSHEAYYDAWAAVGVLSGGMSSRLFTEVREKRGLCYSVYASHTSIPDEGRVLAYAGTTSARAQETLDVMLAEIVRLQEGISQAELDRSRARARSALVMQQESTMRRASAMAGEWHHLGRVTTLDEIRSRIDALTVDSVLQHIRQFPPRDFTVLTIGPQPLEVSVEVP